MRRLLLSILSLVLAFALQAQETVTWSVTQNSAELTATSTSDDLSASYTLGSSLDVYSSGYTKEYNDLNYLQLSFSEKLSSASAANAVDFVVTPAEGKTFAPTSVSFGAMRIGTNNGTIDVLWIDSEGNETSIATGVIPGRNNGTTNDGYEFTYDLTGTAADAGAGYLSIRVYGVATDKTHGLREIVITGTVADEASEEEGDSALDELYASYSTQLTSLLAQAEAKAEELYEDFEDQSEDIYLNLEAIQQYIVAYVSLLAQDYEAGSIDTGKWDANIATVEQAIAQMETEAQYGYLESYLNQISDALDATWQNVQDNFDDELAVELWGDMYDEVADRLDTVEEALDGYNGEGELDVETLGNLLAEADAALTSLQYAVENYDADEEDELLATYESYSAQLTSLLSQAEAKAEELYEEFEDQSEDIYVNLALIQQYITSYASLLAADYEDGAIDTDKWDANIATVEQAIAQMETEAQYGYLESYLNQISDALDATWQNVQDNFDDELAVELWGDMYDEVADRLDTVEEALDGYNGEGELDVETLGNLLAEADAALTSLQYAVENYDADEEEVVAAGFKDFAADLTYNNFLTDDETTSGTAISFGVAVADDGTVSRVDADDASAVAVLSGNYHSTQHGWTSFTCTVNVDGPVKVSVGTCAWGGDVTVAADGVTYGTFTNNDGTCYCNTKNVGYLYYKGDAATLTISGGNYVPYIAVESIDLETLVEEATVTFSVGSTGAAGNVPADMTGDVGSTVTVPANYTLYLEGSTLTGWTDGTTTYVAGDEITLVSGGAELTPVFTANTVSLDDRTEALSLCFDFQRGNGAPTVSYQGKSAIWVTQATINGETIDVVANIDATSGKLANGSWTDWAQMNSGTILTVPACQDATVALYCYSATTTTTFNGSTTYETSGNIVTYTEENDVDEVEIVIGDGSYFRYVQVDMPEVAEDDSALEELFETIAAKFNTLYSNLEEAWSTICDGGYDYSIAEELYSQYEELSNMISDGKAALIAQYEEGAIDESDFTDEDLAEVQAYIDNLIAQADELQAAIDALAALKGDATVTWAFTSGTSSADEEATTTDNVTAAVTVGSEIALSSTKKYNNITYTQIQPSVQASEAADENALCFVVTPADGLAFTPTTVSLNAIRFGTDAGNINITWVSSNGSEEVLAKGITPNRNTDVDGVAQETALSYELPSYTAASEGAGMLKINFYNIATNKTYGVCNVVINGNVDAYDEEAEAVKAEEKAAAEALLAQYEAIAAEFAACEAALADSLANYSETVQEACASALAEVEQYLSEGQAYLEECYANGAIDDEEFAEVTSDFEYLLAQLVAQLDEAAAAEAALEETFENLMVEVNAYYNAFEAIWEDVCENYDESIAENLYDWYEEISSTIADIKSELIEAYEDGAIDEDYFYDCLGVVEEYISMFNARLEALVEAGNYEIVVTPANMSEVSSLSEITLYCEAGIAPTWWVQPDEVIVWDENFETEVACATDFEEVENPEDAWAPSLEINIPLSTTITTAGTYFVEIPAETFAIDPEGAFSLVDYLCITITVTETDGINAVTTATITDAYYTINGVRVSTPVKGINIVNGKKVIVK